MHRIPTGLSYFLIKYVHMDKLIQILGPAATLPANKQSRSVEIIKNY